MHGKGWAVTVGSSSARVGIVEDHALVAFGLMRLLETDDIESVIAPTVPDLLARGESLDLTILDLRLSDGSSVTDNVRELDKAGIPVLVLTSAENAELVREAARANVLGIVRKSLPETEIRDAVIHALAGRPVTSLEWASALDSDPLLPDAGLTPREQEILALYASGETAKSVARLTGLSTQVVANYVGRIRAKYAEVGRPAASRVDLYRRALEDHLIEEAG
ncbi:DNA-binding response regulator [Aeromicrobium camelliae]|uniref:DNA-binding response regulator n=2 Tax=Aeromicrobium camelliae TaxID=1538144 RepID=A0A3N6YV73_9ACTN|nr:DNA-binding response regulator [Aeromicrobium camelliae]